MESASGSKKRDRDEDNNDNDDYESDVKLQEMSSNGGGESSSIIDEAKDAHGSLEPSIIAPRKHHYAMVCSSNMNRSMEAHNRLARAKLNVSSYGVGKQVKLPSPDGRGVTFDFGTPYKVSCIHMSIYIYI